jgi:hypothetical protein
MLATNAAPAGARRSLVEVAGKRTSDADTQLALELRDAVYQ